MPSRPVVSHRVDLNYCATRLGHRRRLVVVIVSGSGRARLNARRSTEHGYLRTVRSDLFHPLRAQSGHLLEHFLAAFDQSGAATGSVVHEKVEWLTRRTTFRLVIRRRVSSPRVGFINNPIGAHRSLHLARQRRAVLVLAC